MTLRGSVQAKTPHAVFSAHLARDGQQTRPVHTNAREIDCDAQKYMPIVDRRRTFGRRFCRGTAAATTAGGSPKADRRCQGPGETPGDVPNIGEPPSRCAP